jgi:isoquinoline 1-oxidoreductase beta subunit
VKQAVRIARGCPARRCKLIWSREEDMQHGMYRPITMARMRAGIDAQGRWTGWHVRIAEQSLAAAALTQFLKDGVDQVACAAFADQFGYDVANYLLDHAMRNTHVRRGRGAPSRTRTTRSRGVLRRRDRARAEARSRGVPPAAGLAKKPKDLAVMEAVAKAAGMGQAAAGRRASRHRRLGFGYGSYSAAVVELSVRDGSVIEVKRVFVALDRLGTSCIRTVRAQIEGSAVWALSAVMHEEITIEKGRVVQGNFDDYPILTLAQTPEIIPILVPSGGFWGGVGEPPFAAIPAAFGNALFAATGKRIRSMPLKHHGFSYA